MGVSDKFRIDTNSCTTIGGFYANDTGMDGKTALTGSEHFTVKEIEVFEIAY
jgi:hypothetical protein